MEEIWKLWKEGYRDSRNRYVPEIWVSNMGNIRGRSVVKSRDGYLTIMYNKHVYKIHRLVAELFISNPDNKPQVDHINTIRSDNRMENLRWCTSKENQNNALSKVHHSKANKEYHADFSRGKHPRSKRVYDIINNRYYDCARDYADSINRPYPTVKRWFNVGKFPSGYSAKYIGGSNVECLA